MKRKQLRKKLNSKIIKYWLPVVLWASIIFLFSSIQTVETTKIYIWDFVIKKSAHMIEFGILTLLIYRALLNSDVKKYTAGYASILFALIYGISDEFHQSFTPGRTPTARDVIFDTIGAILVIYIVWNLLQKAPEKLKNWARKLEVI